MTKEESLYQVKLIIDNLSDEEYNLIPEDDIKYIEENMQVDENIIIDVEKPLDEQDIDDKTYDYLERLIKKIEIKQKEEERENERIAKLYGKYIDYTREDLINEIENYKSENQKIPKAKELVEGYKETLEKQKNEINKLKEANNDLYQSIRKCPKLIQKIFFKDYEQKLLK